MTKYSKIVSNLIIEQSIYRGKYLEYLHAAVNTSEGNNVNTRYLPEKFDEKLKLVNTEVNTHRVFTWKFLRYPYVWG